MTLERLFDLVVVLKDEIAGVIRQSLQKSTQRKPSEQHSHPHLIAIFS